MPELVDLNEDTSPDLTDWIYAVDAAGTTDKKVTIGNLGAVVAQPHSVVWVVDGGGSVVTTGAKKAYVTVPYDCTITGWRILCDVSGSVVFDIWKDTYANYPPTNADSITASAKPTVTTATSAESSTLTGWTTALAAGDVLEVEVESVTTVTKARLELTVDLT